VWLHGVNDKGKTSGTKGSWDGAVAKALAFYQCDLRLVPAQFHMGVKFVVGPCLTPRVFWSLWLSSLNRNQYSKFQFDQNRGPTLAIATVVHAHSVCLFMNYCTSVYKKL